MPWKPTSRDAVWILLFLALHFSSRIINDAEAEVLAAFALPPSFDARAEPPAGAVDAVRSVAALVPTSDVAHALAARRAEYPHERRGFVRPHEERVGGRTSRPATSAVGRGSHRLPQHAFEPAEVGGV